LSILKQSFAVIAALEAIGGVPREIRCPRRGRSRLAIYDRALVHRLAIPIGTKSKVEWPFRWLYAFFWRMVPMTFNLDYIGRRLAPTLEYSLEMGFFYSPAYLHPVAIGVDETQSGQGQFSMDANGISALYIE
jgi:hypothetical protein